MKINDLGSEFQQCMAKLRSSRFGAADTVRCYAVFFHLQTNKLLYSLFIFRLRLRLLLPICLSLARRNARLPRFHDDGRGQFLYFGEFLDFPSLPHACMQHAVLFFKVDLVAASLSPDCLLLPH